MFWRDSQVVEALFGGYNGIFGIVDGVLVRKRCKVLLNLGTDDSNGMIGTSVQSLTDEGGYVRWDVVVGVFGEVAFGGGVVYCFFCGEEGGGGGARRCEGVDARW